MRDPRNWVRPVAAAAIGTAAGAALVVLRVRASQKRRHAQGRSPVQLAGRALHAALDDARRALRERRRRARRPPRRAPSRPPLIQDPRRPRTLGPACRSPTSPTRS